MWLIFWLSVIVLGYTYFLYPLVIWLAGSLFEKKHLSDEDYFPPVSIIIPAYNEQDCIEEKILNSLQLDYPADKLEIIVSSDNSEDGTAEIVRKYLDRGVKFNDFKQRAGKMGVLNKTVPAAGGEILLFTDANAMFDKQVVKKMVRHFADSQVGCVSGAKIIPQGNSPSAEGEGLYWRWESFLKEQESRFSSCAGADGAVYAVRKSLYPFPRDDVIIMDDLAVSLKIIAKGYRCIYDPEAKAYEHSNTGIVEEFRRKGRILAGAITVLRDLSRLLRPGSPIFWQLWSHKVLRWACICFMGLAFFSNIFLASSFPYRLFLFGQSLFYGCALLGFGFESHGQRKRLFYIPFYFVLFNLAQLFGLIFYLRGEYRPAWEKIQR